MWRKPGRFVEDLARAFLVGGALAPAVLFVFIGHSGMAQLVEEDARIQAVRATYAISANPGVWQYTMERLVDQIAGIRHEATNTVLTDLGGKILADIGDKCTGICVSGRAPLLDYGKAVGEVRVEIDLAPVFVKGAILGILGIIGGFTLLVFLNRTLRSRKRADTALRNANEQLELRVAERTEELQRTLQEMEAFNYTVSHDLRSPLRAMNGYCEILLEDYGATIPEEGRNYLVRVANNAARLGGLIDALLYFSRCSRSALSKEPVDFAALVPEIIAEHPALGESAHLCVGSLPPCIGDRVLLRQVMANLIGNSVKFSSKVATPMIEVGYADNAYFVRDNGIGFDMQYADKLFGIFNRLHRIEEFEGTGVGLAIVRRIVERHGGRVWAEAKPGAGATFYFALN